MRELSAGGIGTVRQVIHEHVWREWMQLMTEATHTEVHLAATARAEAEEAESEHAKQQGATDRPARLHPRIRVRRARPKDPWPSDDSGFEHRYDLAAFVNEL